jgi:uroporphyrinogen decarboxylase
MKNMYTWIRNVILSPERTAIPIMTHPGIELCGYKVLDAVKDGKIHFEAIRKLDEIYPAAASTVIMDLTVEAEAFGAEVIFPEDEVPSVINRLVTDFDSVKNLTIPGLEKGRISEYILANRLTAGHITNKPVFGGCIGPFSLAGRLFGMTEIMMALYTEPETVELLLEKCTDFIKKYVEAIKETGVNGIVIAEPAAGLISNDDCITYSSKYVRQIVDVVQDESFIVILHNCGNPGHCTPAMLEAGAAALHFGNMIDIVEVLRNCPEDILIMGNIDPVSVLKMSSPEVIKETTSDLLNKTSEYGNFVLSTGCDVPPAVPMANIEAFYAALKEYNSNR